MNIPELFFVNVRKYPSEFCLDGNRCTTSLFNLFVDEYFSPLAYWEDKFWSQTLYDFYINLHMLSYSFNVSPKLLLCFI